MWYAFCIIFNLSLKLTAIIWKLQKVILEHYNSHSFSISDSNSGKKVGRRERRKKGKEEGREGEREERKKKEIEGTQKYGSKVYYKEGWEI